MARTSAVGSVAAKKQGAAGAVGILGAPASMATGSRFFRFLSAPRGSAEFTNNRYREGGGGRDITLSLKEGLKHGVEVPLFARPTVMAYLLAAGVGSSGPGIAGGGTSSNGLTRPPKIKVTTPASATLTAAVAATSGSVTFNTTTSANTFANLQKVVVGWGPNMEFMTLTGGSTTTAVNTAGCLFPHAKGEPIYEVKGYGTIATIASGAVGLAGFDLSASHGFASADKLAIWGNSTASLLGAGVGAAEELTAQTITANVVSVISPVMRNGHSVGDWVYEYDDTVTTSRIHTFEPVSSLTGSLDYYSVYRSVPGSTNANSILEQVQDSKLSNMTLSGESPMALKMTAGWQGRFAQTLSAPITDDYVNQSSTDLPFRMVNGKHLIKMGTSIDLSTRMRSFEWNFSNITADDIYTDAISSDEILDLARESNFNAQFYFNSSAEYYEVFYGGAAPVSAPTTNITAGSAVLDFTISATQRMSVYIPYMTWESYPVEIDPEPKPIIVEAVGVPLKQSGQPLYSISIQNADIALY